MSEHPLEPLNKICDINPDTLSETADASRRYRYIDLSSIKEQKADLSITPEAFAELPSRARRKVRRNDVLLGTVRPNLKNFALIDSDDDDLLCSTGFAVLRSKKDISDPRFIFQAINSEVVERQLNALVTGSNYPAVNASQVAELLIPVPPLPEQKKIAEILAGIDTLITKSEEKIQKLQISHASLSEQAFCVRLDSESEEFALGDIVTLRHGYQFRTPDFAQHGAKVIKISQVIGDGIVVTENCDRVPRELAADKEKFRLLPGDVLMSLTGNIGRVGIVPETDEFLLQNYRVGLFEAASEYITKEYMIHLLESRHVVSQLEDNSNASAQANFGKGDLDKVVVYLPNASIQRRTASHLSASKDLIKNEKRKAEVFHRIKQSVSADLLSGRRRVSV